MDTSFNFFYIIRPCLWCSVSHKLYLCFHLHGYNPVLSDFSFWNQHMVSGTDAPRSAWPCISLFSILLCSCHFWMGISSLRPFDNFSSSPWVRLTYLTQVWWFTMSPSLPTHSGQAIYFPCSWAPALLSQPHGIYSFLCLESSSHALLFLLQYECEMFHHSLDNLDPSWEIQSLRANRSTQWRFLVRWRYLEVMKVFEGGAQLKNSDTEDYIFGGYILSDSSLLQSFYNMDISALPVFTSKSCNPA